MCSSRCINQQTQRPVAGKPQRLVGSRNEPSDSHTSSGEMGLVGKRTGVSTVWVAADTTWHAPQERDVTSLDELPLDQLSSVHTLDVSHNRLLTLKQLCRVPFLSILNASHNNLSAVLGE